MIGWWAVGGGAAGFEVYRDLGGASSSEARPTVTSSAVHCIFSRGWSPQRTPASGPGWLRSAEELSYQATPRIADPRGMRCGDANQ